MGTFKEWRAGRTEPTAANMSNGKGGFSEWKRKKEKATSLGFTIDEYDYIHRMENKYKSFLSNVSASSKSINSFLGGTWHSESDGNALSSAIGRYKTEADYLLGEFEKNRDKFSKMYGAEGSKQIEEVLSGYSKSFGDIGSKALDIQKGYSAFGSAEEYAEAIKRSESDKSLNSKYGITDKSTAKDILAVMMKHGMYGGEEVSDTVKPWLNIPEEEKKWLKLQLASRFIQDDFERYNNEVYGDIAKEYEAFAYMNDARSAQDFEEKSAATNLGRQLSFGEEPTDYELIYELVNKNADRDNIERDLIGRTSMKGYTTEQIRSFKNIGSEERGVYNYIYATKGGDAAQKYLDSLLNSSEIHKGLSQRRGEQIYREHLEGNTAAELLYSIPAGFTQFAQGMKQLGTDEAVDDSSIQYAGAYAREDITDVWDLSKRDGSIATMLYDMGSTTANMLPSIAVAGAITYATKGTGAAAAGTLLSQAAGSATLGASAAGNAYTEAVKNGYSKEQSKNYAALVGSSEATLQYLLGGVGSLGGISKKAATAINKIDKVFLRVLASGALDAAGEFSEEYLQEILAPVFKNIVFDENNEVKLFTEEALYSGILGALTSVGMNASGAITDTAQSIYSDTKEHTDAGRELLGLHGGADALANEVMNELGIDRATYDALYARAEKLAKAKTNKKGEYSGRTARLADRVFREAYNAKEETASKSRTDIIRKKLESKGVSAEKSGEIASEISTSLEREGAINDLKIKYSEDSQVLSAIEDLTDPESESYDSSLLDIKEEADKSIMSLAMSRERAKAYYETEYSEDGGRIDEEKTELGEIVRFDEIKNEDGEAIAVPVIEVGGNEVSASEIDLKADSIYSNIEGIDVDVANEMISAYKAYGGNVSAESFASDWKMAYQMGLANRGAEHSDFKGYDFKISPEAAEAARALGQDEFNGRTESRKAEIKQAQKNKRGREGHISTDKVQNKKLITEGAQRAAKVLSVAGYNIEFFEDTRETADRGSYSWNENTIRINVAVGTGRVGIDHILGRTLSHELTHSIQRWNPDGYEELKSYVIEKMGDSFEGMVYRRMKQLKLDRADAIDEVVAYSCEMMLRDSKALGDFAKRHRTLFEKICDIVDEFIKKIRSAIASLYGEIGPDSQEARFMELCADELQMKFDKALSDALNASEATVDHTLQSNANKKAAENGGKVQYSKTYTKDGTPVVWIDSNILKGTKGKEHKVVTDYLADHIGDVYTIIESGQKVYLGKDLPSEYMQSKYTQSILRKPQILRAKKRAASNLGEMIEISTNRKWEETSHSHNKDAKYGVYKYTTRFAFPILDNTGTVSRVKAFDATLVILNSSDGKKYLYDLVTIKENTDISGELSERESSPAKRQVQRSGASIDSIPDSSEKSKGKVQKSAREVDPYAEYNYFGNRKSYGETLIDALERTVQTQEDQAVIDDYKKVEGEVTTQRQELAKLNQEINDTIYTPMDQEEASRLEGLRNDAKALGREIKALERDIKKAKDSITVTEKIISDPSSTPGAKTGALGRIAAERQALARLERELSAKKTNLSETEATIKEARDPRVTKLSELRDKATKLRREISKADKTLLEMRSTKRFKTLIAREKAQAIKDTKALMYRRQKESRVRQENTVIRQHIWKEMQRLDKLLATGTVAKHIPSEMISTVAELSRAVPGRDVDYDTKIASLEEQLENLTGKEYREAREQLEKYTFMKGYAERTAAALEKVFSSLSKDSPIFDQDVFDDVKALSEEINGKSINELQNHELSRLLDVINEVKAAIKNADRVFGEKRSLTSLGLEGTDEVLSAKKEIELSERRKKLYDGISKAGYAMLKPYELFEMTGSKVLYERFRKLQAREGTYYADIEEASSFFKEVAKKNGITTRQLKEKFSYKTFEGREVALSIDEIMSIYLMSRRAQAMVHLTNPSGGFRFAGGYTVETKKAESAKTAEEKMKAVKYTYKQTSDPVHLTEADVYAIANMLTKKQKAFADSIQRFMASKLGAKGNEVSTALYDVKKFTDPDYFPIHTDAGYRLLSIEKAAGEIQLKNLGFTKDLKYKASGPLVLESMTEVFARHANEMSLYHAFAIELENLKKVLNYSDPITDEGGSGKGMKAALGDAMTREIVDFIKAVNGGIRSDNIDIADRLISLNKGARVGASLSVAIQQPSAIIRAFSMIDPKYVTGFLHMKKADIQRDGKIWEEMKKYTATAGIKELGGVDVNTSRAVTEQLTDLHWRDRTAGTNINKGIQRAVYILPEFMDKASWCILWTACKREAAQTYRGTEILEKAGERFDEIVNRTQVYDSVFSRSKIMRSHNTFAKMVTAFMAEPMTTANMVIQAARDVTSKDPRKIKAGLRSIGAVSASIIINNALVSIIYAMRDDDEDESYLEKYTESFLQKMGTDLNILSYIPLAKDLLSIVQGYDVERMDMSLISDIIDSAQALVKLWKNENATAGDWVNAWIGFGGRILDFAGIPASNLSREFEAAANTINTLSTSKTTKQGYKEALFDGLFEDTVIRNKMAPSDKDSDKLYRAIESGDKARFKQITDRLDKEGKTTNQIQSLIVTGLKENDKRIVAAAEAKNSGNLAEYKKIVDDISKDGFASSYVAKAVQSVVAKMNQEAPAEDEYGTPDPAENDKYSSIFSADDIFINLEAGDTAEAQVAINDIFANKYAEALSKLKDDEDEDDAERSAYQSLRSMISADYRELYKAGDNTERERIKELLLDIYVNGEQLYKEKTIEGWGEDD